MISDIILKIPTVIPYKTRACDKKKKIPIT